jgi:hypothetical protein
MEALCRALFARLEHPMICPSCPRVLLLLFLSMVSVPAEAADDYNSAAEMYSLGVHSYFSGNLNRADIYLYRAVELSPNDPRPYYFRGLVLLRLGRTFEADDMMEQGAAAEAAANSDAYGIGEVLERVQGADRLRLEKFRRAGKFSQANVAVENSRRRQERHERIQAQAQRRPVRLPLEALVNPVEPNQFAGLIVPDEPLPEAAPPAEPPAIKATIAAPAAVAPVDEGDPFADDPIATTPSVETPPPAADIAAPGPASGSVKAGSLPGIFGRIIGRQLPSVDVGRLRSMVPGAGGGQVPPAMPEDFGGEFPPGADPSFGAEMPQDFGAEVPPSGDPFSEEMPSETGEPPTEIPTPPAEDGENPF